MATLQRPPQPRADEDDEPGFLARYRVPLIIVGVLVIGGLAWAVFNQPAPKRKASVQTVQIMQPLPPPPPPTPPPPTPPPPQEPPPDKPPEFQQEMQPEEKPPDEPKPAEPPDAPLGTNLQGDGNDGFGLAGGNGNGFGKGLGSGSGNRSKYGWYAGQVQGRVVAAMRAHKLLRSAALTIEVRIWADSTGRVTRATLSGSSGSSANDAALRDEVLTGLQLSEPPPDGMPMPIVMRITAKRPR